MTATSAEPSTPSSPRVLCLGELMWDLHAQDAGELADVDNYRRQPGGGAANVALRLHGLGIRSGVAGLLGDDEFGHGMRRALVSRGVDVAGLQTAAGRTGVVFVERGGRGRFLSFRAEWRGLPQTLPTPSAGCELVHVAALEPRSDVQRLLTRFAIAAREQGALVVVDLNTRPRAWRGRKLHPPALQLLRNADVVKASHDDLRVLGEGSAPASLAGVRQRWRMDGVLLVTRGGASTSVVADFGGMRMAPLEVAKVARTVGAGDAFCAGLIARLLDVGMVAADRAVTERRRCWRNLVEAGHASAAEHLRE